MRLAAALGLALGVAVGCQPENPREGGSLARKTSADAMRADSQALKRGKALFVGTCAGYCHSPSVERAAPNLFDCTWRSGGGGDQELFDIIASGVPGTAMIGFKGKLPEGDDDIWRLVAYISAAAPAC